MCKPLLFLFAMLSAASAAAQDHPWLSAPLMSRAPATSFTNLDDGARIETPFLLKFGLSRFGLAPIVKSVDRTGHHHLLVNRDLPLDFQQALPFNDQYIHFGKGQMETVLNFPPGEYTLRLLLANHEHIPHFIYSKPLRVTVTRQRDDIDATSLVTPGVNVLEPVSGATVRPPFRLRLHASGLNVSHADIQDPGVGHFQLVLEQAGAKPERIALTEGWTEAWLSPPPGRYRVHAEFVANADGRAMHRSTPVDLQVSPP